MAFYKYIVMYCDGCATFESFYQTEAETVSEARKILSSKGWVYKNKEDFCKNCKKKMEEK